MNNVLYEAGFKLDALLVIPVVMLVFIALFPVLWKIYEKNNEVKIDYKTVKSLCLCMGAFVTVFLIISWASHLSMYNKIVGAYNNGQYEIVEGYVENFVPMPYEGHSNESFEINGVEFSYSDYESHQGYNNTKSHDGVIEGNGQHLKIGYIYYNKTYGNIIVYIEELSWELIKK